MNAFAPIGLGQSLARGLRRRTEETRATMAREMTAMIEHEYRVWLEDVGTHPADVASSEIIARLRRMTGATRVVGPSALPSPPGAGQ